MYVMLISWSKLNQPADHLDSSIREADHTWCSICRRITHHLWTLVEPCSCNLSYCLRERQGDKAHVAPHSCASRWLQRPMPVQTATGGLIADCRALVGAISQNWEWKRLNPFVIASQHLKILVRIAPRRHPRQLLRRSKCLTESACKEYHSEEQDNRIEHSSRLTHLQFVDN